MVEIPDYMDGSKIRMSLEDHVTLFDAETVLIPCPWL